MVHRVMEVTIGRLKLPDALAKSFRVPSTITTASGDLEGGFVHRVIRSHAIDMDGRECRRVTIQEVDSDPAWVSFQDDSTGQGEV